MNDYQVSKDKFVLVQKDQVLFDEAIKTESIGYYKDAWYRFKKNKASVVAAIIMILLVIMAIVGPFLNKYDLDDQSAKWATRLQDMPPKVEALSWWGLFDGTKEIEGTLQEFNNLPDGIVVKVVERNADTGLIKVQVNYYEYVNYYYSLRTNPVTGAYEPSAFTSLSIAEYEAAKAAELATGETIILQDAALVNGSYKVRVDFYKFLEHVYGVEELGFWFGSDSQGREIFTLVWEGARLSLMIAFGVAMINIIIGVIVGSISGYYGGTIDLVIERVSEILSGLPFLAILTLLLLRFGNQVWVVILAFTMTGWLGIASLTRVQFYRYKNREYVLAARTLGARDRRIMSRHIFPNAVGTIITSLALYIPSVIFIEATYSYLGIINYANSISIGRLLSTGQNVLKTSFYQVVFPSIFISLLMLSFNLFGNGLRDAFNPSLRGVEE